ncbi:Uncharacterized protein Rs2_46722 [Raphanus sativus]|nr:Uncharacterized protein Rs2_46722 [Raphanus sativus]
MEGEMSYFPQCNFRCNAGEACFYNLVARDTDHPSAAPPLRSYAKVETLTIAELNNFVITAPSQMTTMKKNNMPDGKPIPVKFESGGWSGEESTKAGEDPAGCALEKMDDTSSNVIKKTSSNVIKKTRVA